MGLKDIKHFTPEEVGLWLTAQGLGEDAPKFIEEGVDGNLLCSLTAEELKTDLGLSSLQSKKVLKNIQFSQSLTAEGEGGDQDVEKLKHDIEVLEGRVERRNKEIQYLTEQLDKMRAAEPTPVVEAEPEPEPEPAPVRHAAPAPAPPPQEHHSHGGRRGPGVVGGAARGAAGGAVKGAIIGAVLPGMEASDGAAAGAAAGAFSGGVGGLRGRRGRRFG